MPIYDMTTGKQIEIDGGPETYTVMEYNKETGEIEYSVKETPKHISKNSLEKILKSAEAEEKRKKKLAKKDGKLAVPSDESSTSGNSSESDSEDSDDTGENSEAKKIVEEWTPEENMKMIDNLKMKMENEPPTDVSSESDSESESEDSEDTEEDSEGDDDDSEGPGDSESEDSEYTYDSQSGILTKHGASGIMTENSSEGFNLEDVKKVFNAKAKEMREKRSSLNSNIFTWQFQLKMIALTCVFSYLYVMSGPRIVSYFYPEINGKK